MALLSGAGTLADGPTALVATAAAPDPGSPITSSPIEFVDFTGGGGSAPVDPKRYLNVGGVATAIQ